MNNNKKYLAHNNLPPKLPTMTALWTATTLKVFNAPEWLWGVMGVLYFTILISEIVRIATHEKVEL